jgi:hypothetical protein
MPETEDSTTTYYTRVPNWAAESLEQYQEQNDVTKSEAAAHAIIRGIRKPTYTEQVATRVAEISFTVFALFSVVWVSSWLGGLVGAVTQSAQTTVMVYSVIFGPSALLVSILMTAALRYGTARWVGERVERLGGFNEVSA